MAAVATRHVGPSAPPGFVLSLLANISSTSWPEFACQMDAAKRAYIEGNLFSLDPLRCRLPSDPEMNLRKSEADYGGSFLNEEKVCGIARFNARSNEIVQSIVAESTVDTTSDGNSMWSMVDTMIDEGAEDCMEAHEKSATRCRRLRRQRHRAEARAERESKAQAEAVLRATKLGYPSPAPCAGSVPIPVWCKSAV